MGRRLCCYSAVAVIGVASLSGNSVDKRKSAWISYLSSLAGIDNVCVGNELITSRSVKTERNIDIEAVICVHKSLHACGKELSVTHFSVAVVFIKRNLELTLKRASSVRENLAVSNSPHSFGNKIKHLGIVIGIVGTVLLVVADLHLGGRFHLS